MQNTLFIRYIFWLEMDEYRIHINTDILILHLFLKYNAACLLIHRSNEFSYRIANLNLAFKKSLLCLPRGIKLMVLKTYRIT